MVSLVVGPCPASYLVFKAATVISNASLLKKAATALASLGSTTAFQQTMPTVFLEEIRAYRNLSCLLFPMG